MLARRGAALLTILGLGLTSGCSHTVTVDASRTLRVAITEYRLNPEGIRMSAGPVSIVVHNFGRLTHNLVLALGRKSLGSTKPLAPGQSGQLAVTLQQGSYSLASSIGADGDLGVYGTLEVGR